ncbi:MFS transporter [Streptomyces flaveolus]|uniref:MFS transporter n=1 Tax=Streptomyces flaveolus TaxID=67297 RepID=UPI0033E70D88
MKNPSSRPGDSKVPETSAGPEVPVLEATSSGRHYEVRIVALLAVGFGLVGLDRNIIAPLFPAMVEDLGLTYQDLGIISGVLALFWGLASIIAGSLSDRIGRRKVLIPAVIDPRRGVDEQFGHPRFGAGELAGGVDVVGLAGPEVADAADGLVRGHRGERSGVGHVGSSTYGPPR